MVYDFDGTLSPEAMQHYGVLPNLGIEPSNFWAEVKAKRKSEKAEELLVYMREMIKLADQKDVKLGRDDFASHGASIEFFEGVRDWFQRINEFVKGLAGGAEIEVEHYIISAGLKEMIEGCDIASEFTEIFACEFLYDKSGHPIWPARIISDTSKTQYLFRINKGVLDVNESINSHMPTSERRIPFDNMVYFGDGETDVPSMAVVMAQGGHAVAVHKPNEGAEKCLALRQAGRIDYFCEADYREGSDLDRLVKDTLRVIVSRIALRMRIFDLPPKGCN
nr:HAD family hydrolase [Shimia biformata]